MLSGFHFCLGSGVSAGYPIGITFSGTTDPGSPRILRTAFTRSLRGYTPVHTAPSPTAWRCEKQVLGSGRSVHHPPVAGSARIAGEVRADDDRQRRRCRHLGVLQGVGKFLEQRLVVHDHEDPRLAVHGRRRGHRRTQQQFDRIGPYRTVPVGANARARRNHVEGAPLPAAGSPAAEIPAAGIPTAEVPAAACCRRPATTSAGPPAGRRAGKESFRGFHRRLHRDFTYGKYKRKNREMRQDGSNREKCRVN